MFAAAMIAGACVVGALAQSAEEEDDSKAAAETPAPKGKKRQDPAEAQRAIDAALKQVQAGRAEQAVQAMSATLAGGNLPPGIMAKAFYVRGMAHRRQGRPAQAISDLNSALWLKGGLGGDDRVEATRERASAYADAGLGAPDESAAPASKTSSGSNWFSGIFGGSSAPPPPPSPPPRAPPKVTAAIEEPAPPAKTAAPPVDGWANKTYVDRAPAKAPAPPRAAAAAPASAPAASSKLTGGYVVQLGAVRTEAEALALATRVKREQGSALATRQQSIDRQVFGNMGAFYRVRFGPFASAQETEAVCTRLRGAGIDCMSVGP